LRDKQVVYDPVRIRCGLNVSKGFKRGFGDTGIRSFSRLSPTWT